MARRRAGNDGIAAILKRLAQMQQQQREQMAAAAAATTAAVAALQPPLPAPVEIDWMTRFRKSEPPRFEGGNDLDGSQRWIQEVEKILRSLQPPVEQRVRLAEYMLTSEAEHWWEQQRRSLKAANQVVTWELFKSRFLGKYFPEDVRREKEIAFLQLTQGPKLVGDYAALFEDLIRFSGNYVDADERTKCIKFEAGLRDDIHLSCEYHNIGNLSQLVSMASTYEKGLKRMSDNERFDKGKELAPESGPCFDINNRAVVPRDVALNGDTPVVRLPCPLCGKPHRRLCLLLKQHKNKGLCYICGQPGHIGANCPRCIGEGSE